MLVRVVPRRSGLRRAGNAAWCCVLLSVFACAQSFALNPNWKIYQYGHRTWKSGEAFPGGDVLAIAQDGEGYLWAATADGLFRFDGFRFTAWKPPSGSHLPDVILSLLAGRDGSLWMGTTDGVYHWDHHRLSVYQNHPGTLVQNLLEDKEGAIWFTPYNFGSNADNNALLCRIAHSVMQCYGNQGGGLPPPPTIFMTSDPSGKIWMGRNEGLVSWKDGSVTAYRPDSLRNNTSQEGILALAVDADGSLLAGITKSGPGLGLERYRNGTWTAVTAPGFDGSAHLISYLLMDAHHALWIGTTSEGLYRLYHGEVDHLSVSGSLSGNRITSIYEDREGSLWVGTEGGIDQFRDLAVQNFSRAVYPKADEFDNIVTLPDGSLWIGGYSRLYSLSKESTTFIPQGGKAVAGKQVTTIFGDREGRVWVGMDNALNLFSHGRFLPVHMQDGHPVGFILSMAEGANGALWALTGGPPRTILSIDAHAMRAAPELPTVNASKIAADAHGGLWIGLNTGDVLHDSNETITTVRIPHGTNARIAQLLVMDNGGVLAAGAEGLAWLHHGQVDVLGVRNGLPCANINSLVFDRTGNLWLYALCGLVAIDQAQFRRWQQNPAVLVQFRVFDSSDGFISYAPPFESAARSANGRLWFNALRSLMVIDPAHLFLNEMPPPVHIEAMRADYRGQALDSQLRLPPLTRDLEIDYAALSFVAPQKVRFRYRLFGFDRGWQDVGPRREALYTNLGPRSYKFQVIACNNDGVWNSAGDTLSFAIPPRFYQTNWFMACIVIAVLALIYGIFIVRLRVSTRLLESRMNERLLERDRIARELHDTLLQGFHGIILRLQGIAGMMPDSSPPRLALESTMDRADQVLVEGRRNLLHLRSDASTEMGLAEQLNGVIADLQQQNLIACGVRLNGQERALRPTVHEEIFAMAREALTNAFRHSDAIRILIELSFTQACFSLRCSDDGIGLPAEVLKTGLVEGHWGLVGLRERAENLHARLSLRNNKPHGTVLEIVVRGRIAYSRRGLGWLKRLIPGVGD
ncbi:MAG TPA: two-component regulator propeller domain-containing protein [Acidobacteriaceae bacterium]|nr:two-component regulator propeller domain-containing protein [Acidobacteriaceae bacterium]